MKKLQILSLIVLMSSVLPGSLALCGDAPWDLLSKPLTMEEAVAYGLEHNTALRASQEEVRAVGQQVRQSRAEFFPKIDAGYDYRYLKDEPFASFDLAPGIPPVKFQTGYRSTSRWEMNLTQPLFTGFGLTAQFNISKMNLEISKYRMEGTRLDVIRDIKNAFIQTLLGEKLLQVSKDNVQSLEVQRSNAHAYYKEGLTPQNDVLKADVALADAKQRERTAAKQVAILRSQLNQLLDLNVSTVLSLSDVEVHLHIVPPPLSDLYSLSEQQRPEYLSLDTSIRQAKEGIRLAQSRYYPQLSAFGQYYREGEGFGTDDNQFANTDNAAVGVRLDLNLFEGGKTHAAVMESEYRQRSLEQQHINLREQIKVEVEDAYEKLRLSKSNIHTAEVALKQAEENDRMTSLQYKNQLVIFLEVLNAQVFVLQSRVNYYQALYGYALAWADLERAVGGPVSPR